MRKLTLSAKSDVIALAKRIAQERRTSVSEMFSQFIRSMAGPRKQARHAGKTRRATGLVQWPIGRGDRELIEEAMSQRFMR